MFGENYLMPEICSIDGVSTIKQSTYYYCAAACVKMCLNDNMSQDEIFESLKARTKDQENWYAEPDAVYSYLSEHRKCYRTSELCDSSKVATEWILSCIATTKMSAPMLVSGGKHWVLYSGYQMDYEGNAKGIYIRDPWPTMATISFYPFCTYFFDEYFCGINVEGKLKNKVESFVSPDTIKCISINIISKPANGGTSEDDIGYFKREIINEDMGNYGFGKVGFLKNGGTDFVDCVVYDSDITRKKYLLSFFEMENALYIAAIDIALHSVIGVIHAKVHHYSLYDKKRVKKEFFKKYGKNIDSDKIFFVHKKFVSTSCFDPIIVIEEKEFNLDLEPIA